MRIGIIALQHESNTFLRAGTELADFSRDVLAVGEDVRRIFARAHHEVGGFFEGLAGAGVDATPVFAARATPSGVIAASAGRALVEMLLGELSRAGDVDGLLVAPHGAAVCEAEPDFDGHWLALVRRQVGDTVPIVCTLDLHANVSPRMVQSCNATIAYRTNPHLDQRQRGRDAAELLVRAVRGEVNPVQALAMPPVAINIERQLTDESPCADLFAAADAQLRRPGVLGNSVVLGFPYSDVAEMGSSVIAITDGDAELAGSLADEIAGQIVGHRDDFAGRLVSVEAATAMLDEAAGPTCLLDTGDNVGGGSPGDGTILLHALARRGKGTSLVKLFDPSAVRAATDAGIGAVVRLHVGGKSDDLHGPPFAAEFQVRHLCEGRWFETEVRHGGATGGEMGPCAVVQTGGVTVLLTSRRVPPFSLAPLLACGIDPGRFDVLVAKGVHAPVAAYRTVCRRFIRVNTPGVTDADMTRLPFQHRRRPMYPFEAIGLEAGGPRTEQS